MGTRHMRDNYEELKSEVKRLQEEGRLEKSPNREQRIDWAFGTTVIENKDVTREMVERADDLAAVTSS
jgi:hypothetical protein